MATVRLLLVALLGLGLGLAPGAACGGDSPGTHDGSTDGQGSQCGNGQMEDLEECDDGEDNSDTVSGACRTDCTRYRCGDGVSDPQEDCDDGAGNSDTVPGACRTDCVAPRCGDGVVDVPIGEACDDGPALPTTTCSAFCQVMVCGNGVLDPNEVCDDGNLLGGDGCSATCSSDETCGNGVVDLLAATGPEDCDDGNVQSDDGCSSSCRSEYCGNGIRDAAELCDDGNSDFGDGCTPDCASLEVCGNGYLDWALDETCDDGNMNNHDGCASSCQQESPAWTDVTGSDTPIPRTGHAMVYDAHRGRIVLFGGTDDSAPDNQSHPLNETWEFDGTRWLQVFPPYSPPTRWGHAMVYDGARKRVVLYGGWHWHVTYRDTWEYDGRTWVQVNPPTPPGERWGHAMAYDGVRQKVVMHGGYDWSSHLSDTWEYDGQSWTEITVANAPPARMQAGMVFDSAQNRVVLQGGWNRDTATYFSETWGFDGVDWTQLAGPVSGLNRRTHALAFNPRRNQIMLFGGAGTVGASDVFFSDTWTFDGASWTQLSLPAAPASRGDCGGGVYDTQRDRVVIAGGYYASAGNSVSRNDTWELGPTGWSQWVAPALPPARLSASLANDPVRSRVVLFGGWTMSGGSDRNDTWEHDGRRWQQVTTATTPPARRHAAMTWDASGQQVVLFGGASGWVPTSDRADTWVYDGTDWAQVTTANAPPGRSKHQLAYDTARERVVLFGGDGAVEYNDTWEFDGTDWTQVTTTNAPVGRVDFGMTYDAARGRVVLFGGWSINLGDYLYDTWEYDGNDWTQVSTTSVPSGRYGHRMAYDAARGRVVLFGGEELTWNGVVDDTWEYDGNDWYLTNPALSPSPRFGYSVVYDTGRKGVLLFGGFDWNSYLNDTWYYRYQAGPGELGCELGTDGDGDGLIACQDPDCAGLCATCGDGTCDPQETCGFCPADCGACAPVCGNFRCDEGEQCVNCPTDCECATEEDCFDGGDDDGDGLADCADPDCACPAANCTVGSDCLSGICTAGTCAAFETSCLALLTAQPATPDGPYVIDPDGSGGASPFPAYCDMTTDGGGWTLVAVTSDDGDTNWSWSRRGLLGTDTGPVGLHGNWHRDYKSPAYHALAFTDLLFRHNPSGIWGAYHTVGDSTTDLGTFTAAKPENSCDLNGGYPLSAGTLTLSGDLCSTDLYFNMGDEDGGAIGANCFDTSRNYYNGSYGPTWNALNNTICELDDPAYSAWGPDRYGPITEATGRGFARPLSLDTGAPGSAQNYLQMYVR